MVPCPPEKWVVLETGCTVDIPVGPAGVEFSTPPPTGNIDEPLEPGQHSLAENQCCGVVGTQSPIDAKELTAPEHPVKLPHLFVQGHPASRAGPPKPGKLPVPLCSQAFFIANQHGLKVSFDYAKYWRQVEEEWESAHYGQYGGHAQGHAHHQMMTGGPTPPPEPRCIFPLAGFQKGFPLMEYHWHSPSEHTVDGGYFPAEAHHLHVKKGKGVVIAVFITGSLDLRKRCATVGQTPADAAQANECNRALFFDKVMNMMPFTPQHTVVTEEVFIARETTVHGSADPNGQIKEVSALRTGYPGEYDPYSQFNDFVPYMDYFYNYFGSLTQPPCSVGIEWVLNPYPVTVFDDSLQKLRQNMNGFQPNVLRQPAGGLPGEPGTVGAAPITWHKDAYAGWFTWTAGLGTNNRPIQPLAGPACPVDPKAVEAMAETTVMPGELQKGFEPRGMYQECPRQFWRIGSPLGNGPKPMKYLDSSPMWASGLPNSLHFATSASGWSESDIGGSDESLDSMGSGSSGFYMALWKWAVVAAFTVCGVSLCSYYLWHTEVPEKYRSTAKKGDDDHGKKESARDIKKEKHHDEDPLLAPSEMMLVPLGQQPLVTEYVVPTGTEYVYPGAPVTTTPYYGPGGVV